ncbi:hypothetical protein JMJ35_002311 [Cladonia borealis]|uniref:Heterokaryon incompatibility domain-containing protein n=1 Tax=Cladonia borealis TaxID=184061 RepID=A0AA39V3W2_9LECA|nr:hypothetical protein JMJ35_002311 [Cladonia borealis]
MKPYKYSNLNGDEIRLLHLLPRSASREVRIKIETVTLSADQHPQYEALSYAWGSTKDPSRVVVTVDHTYGFKNRALVSFPISRSISVTRNLAEALPYLRDATKPRTLWIDAICIDQKNGKEKGEQVSRMGEIFKSSSQVLVWLGPEMSASSAVIEFLNDLSCQISVDWATMYISSRPGAVKDWRRMVDSFYNSEQLVHGLSQLVIRPWFERLWVWQEIRAKDSALVMCSCDRILWQDLRSATQALLESGQRGNLSGPLSLLGSMADGGIGFQLDICTFLTWHSICADPRDRIFALKSLLNPIESDAIKPDYEKSTSEVYRDVVIEYALNLGRLDLLRLCDLSTKLEESPSWVPNWSSPKENLMVTGFHASARSTCEANVGMEIMEVAGTYCATVTQVDFLFDAGASNMEIVSKISEMVSLQNMNASYIGGGNMLSAYCRTLFEDIFSETYLPPRSDMPSFEHSKGILQAIVARNGDHGLQFTSEISNSVDFLRVILAGRTFFMTREGYIGTSVVEPRLGDQVVVLLGSDSPLLLRAARGSHQVVGECYVQGLMYAEALLGPMSEGWENIWRLSEALAAHYPAFVHRPSGRVQCEDPRLGQLPEGWCLKSNEAEDALPIYVNKRTGETCGKAYISDPRMTSEELRLRGVDMRTFRLV